MRRVRAASYRAGSCSGGARAGASAGGSVSSHAAELVLQPGSTLVLQFEGASDVRCAIFRSSLRVKDFTLRPGKSATAVVPAGGLRVRVYAGQHVVDERALELAAGTTETLLFSGDA